MNLHPKGRKGVPMSEAALVIGVGGIAIPFLGVMGALGLARAMQNQEDEEARQAWEQQEQQPEATRQITKPHRRSEHISTSSMQRAGPRWYMEMGSGKPSVLNSTSLQKTVKHTVTRDPQIWQHAHRQKALFLQQFGADKAIPVMIPRNQSFRFYSKTFSGEHLSQLVQHTSYQVIHMPTRRDNPWAWTCAVGWVQLVADDQLQPIPNGTPPVSSLWMSALDTIPFDGRDTSPYVVDQSHTLSLNGQQRMCGMWHYVLQWFRLQELTCVVLSPFPHEEHNNSLGLHKAYAWALRNVLSRDGYNMDSIFMCIPDASIYEEFMEGWSADSHINVQVTVIIVSNLGPVSAVMYLQSHSLACGMLIPCKAGAVDDNLVGMNPLEGFVEELLSLQTTMVLQSKLFSDYTLRRIDREDPYTC